MAISLETPTAGDLRAVAAALARWQVEGAPVQVHPGDLGWALRWGAEVTAAAVRTWRRDGHLLALALVDGGEVRMALAPKADDDEELARRICADLSEPERGMVPAGEAAVEARCGTALRRRLSELGWESGEAWTPLVRSLAEPVADCGLRLEVVGAHRAADEVVAARVAVQRAAFERSTFTVEAWHAMAAGSPYDDARCVVAYDDRDVAVAAVTVWSAGVGRPGLLEPLGVHRDHRGHGYGRAIGVAAAATLRELGSSSATVCTPSANVAAVAAYVSAGFVRHPDSHDFSRP